MISKLLSQKIGSAAHVLTRAFHDDPLSVYACPDPKDRPTILEWLFLGHLRYAHLFGEAYTASDPVLGTAIWLCPGDHVMDEPRMAEAGLLPNQEQSDSLKRAEPVFALIGSAHEREAPSRHWYLDFIGVEPDHQGEGIGGRLLRPILAAADHDALPCYTWTAQPKNVAFYQKHDFRVCTDIVEPETGVHVWTFLRHAQR